MKIEGKMQKKIPLSHIHAEGAVKLFGADGN